jgi:hypothetical protein
LWLAIAFVAGLLAVGVPYWQLPYSEVSLPDTLISPSLLVVVLAAAVARAIGKCHFIPTLIVAGSAVPAAVMGRVLVDTLQDPTSHNLWPFELIIAAGVGLLASTGGALLGSIPGFTSGRSSTHDT